MKAARSILPLMVLALCSPTPVKATVRSAATLTIKAPLATVWGLVTDVDHWPAWNRAVQSAHLDGKVSRGSVFNWKSGGFAIRSTFQEVAPMTRLAWSGRTIGTRALHAWTFRSVPGGVEVTTWETFDGWLPALAPRMMQKQLDDTLPALLASLKTAAERRPRE